MTLDRRHALRQLPRLAVAALLVATGCGAPASDGVGRGIDPPLASVRYFGADGGAPEAAPCSGGGSMPTGAAGRCWIYLGSDAVVTGQVTQVRMVSGPTVWNTRTNQAEPASSCTGTLEPVLEIDLKVRDRLRGEVPDTLRAVIPSPRDWNPYPVASDGGVTWQHSLTPQGDVGPIVVGQALGAFLVQDRVDGLWVARIFDLAPKAGTTEAAACFQPIACAGYDFPEGCTLMAKALSQDIYDCETGRIPGTQAPPTPTTDERRRSALPGCHP